jgi:hypothetical protein
MLNALYKPTGGYASYVVPAMLVLRPRIYNDWPRDFCSRYPDRQIGLAYQSYDSAERAVEEVHRGDRYQQTMTMTSSDKPIESKWNGCFLNSRRWVTR